MIVINKQYGVEPTKWSYNLVRFTKDKEGKPTNEIVGFYHDFNAALKGYVNLKVKKKLTQKDMSVAEAVKEIDEVRRELKEILDGATNVD